MRSVRNHRYLLSLGAAFALTLAACGRDAPREAQALPPAFAVVDSIIAPEEALRRFREGLGEAPSALRGGRSSREALVEAVVSALAARDTAAFEPIALDRAEFAYLYFPDSPVARPPYELPPGLAWMQLQKTNRTSVFRSLDSFGGMELRLIGHRCDPEPSVQGRNRVWSGCTVAMRVGTDTVSARLVGGILERDGVFKVLSYATDR